MKKILYLTLTLIAFCLLVTIAFYLWASSPNHVPSDYSLLIEKELPASLDEDSIYSIVTYNIGYLSGMTNNLPVVGNKSLYDKNLKKALSVFKVLDPDIICLQEIDFNSKRSFYVNQQDAIQNLGYNHAFQAVNWDEKYLPFPGSPLNMDTHYGAIYSGQSIISKFPLKDIERVVLERPETLPLHENAFYLDRLVQQATVEIDGKKLYLLNVHLEAFDKATRVKQVKRLVDLIKDLIEEVPVLLVGDFNSNIAEEAACIHTIANLAGMTYAKTGTISQSLTFPSDKPIERLDYIFYNQKYIAMEQAKVLQEFGTASDHLPVLLSFRLK